MISIPPPKDFRSWRETARRLLDRQIEPRAVLWLKRNEVEEGLFGQEELPEVSTKALQPNVPKAFLELAEVAACHRSEGQWALLYSLLWRLTHGEKHLLQVASDSELHRVQMMVKEIRRDSHKMHAFVRFRKVGEDEESGREQFVAWFEPDHLIVRRNASFFRKRFTNMDWSILTPDECMHWDGEEVRFTAGVSKESAPEADELEEYWKSYYRSIFNVARVKVKAMQAEMPKKYWKNLPEAPLIEELIAESGGKTRAMLEKASSPESPIPDNAYLKRLHSLPDE